MPTVSRDETDSRFENMVKAKEVCIVNDLGLLVIPHAKKFIFSAEGNQYKFIAEESLDFSTRESVHEELYHKYSKDLNETARQLAIFIAKTGFNDVTWRNVPIIDEAPEYKGPRRVALIDLEHMKNKVNGFIGDMNGSCGLIRCVSEEQIDLVIAEARKQGVVISDKDVQWAKSRRLKELESDKQLRQFHQTMGIVTGKEPMQVDIDSLGLDLAQEGQIQIPVERDDGKNEWKLHTVSLREVAEYMIEKNESDYSSKSDQDSLKRKRHLYININNYQMRQYHELGLPKDKFFDITKEEEKQRWPRQIIEALVKNGYLFNLDETKGYDYFVQA